MQTWRFQNPRIWNYPRSIRNFWIYMQNAKIPGSPRYPSYVRRYPRRYLASHDDQHIGQKLHSIRTLLELSNYADGLLTSFPARFPYDPFSIELTNRREWRKAGGDKAPMSPIVGGIAAAAPCGSGITNYLANTEF